MLYETILSELDHFLEVFFNQKSLYMYDITTISVLYHMNEELIDDTESKYTYAKIKPSTEVLALGRSNQINLGYHDLVHCIQYNIIFLKLEMNTLLKDR